MVSVHNVQDNEKFVTLVHVGMETFESDRKNVRSGPSV